MKETLVYVVFHSPKVVAGHKEEEEEEEELINILVSVYLLCMQIKLLSGFLYFYF